jgi:ATP-binding cassette subfamily C protein CydD
MDKRLFAEAKTARLAFMLTIGLSIVHALVILLQAFLLSRTIHYIFLQGQTLDDVIPYLVGLLITVAVRAVVNGINDYAASQIAISVKEDLRQRLVNHMIQLGPAYTKGERSGELVLAATEGIEALDAYFKDYLPGLFTAVLIPVVILFVVFPIDWLTFIVLLVTAPLIPFFMALIGMAAGKVARRNYMAMGRMSAHFMDILQGITTLKLFNRSRHQIQTIARITDNFRETTMGVLRVAFLSAFTLELLATLSVAVVAVEIGLRLIAGTMAFEQALFLLVIAPEFYLPLRALGVKFHAGTEGAAAATRIYEVLETPLPQKTTAIATVPDNLHIRFEGVGFTYATARLIGDEESDDSAHDDDPSETSQERPALENIDLQLPVGQRVALVGASGGGKSTVANLLLGFIQPTTGNILVDDTDLQMIPLNTWRKKIAWVPQSPYIFNTSIAENIRVGRQDATLAEVQNAAQHARVHDFIMSLPDGYETIVGERGSRLSGGQAQRIAIARAFLKDAPIIILDEATSNLDPDTESQIETALEELLAGRTALVIAHRLNTIFKSDHIIVMDAGNIVEQGTHDELLQQRGIYHELVESFGSFSYA